MSAIPTQVLYAVDNISNLYQYLTHTPCVSLLYCRSLFGWYSPVQCRVVKSCLCTTRARWQLYCVVCWNQRTWQQHCV